MARAGGRSPRTHTAALSNGLTVILAPEPRSPTASVWVWYRVGSRNEHPGITGASHWVEHMLFQGSPRYGKGAIDRAVVEVGGTLNAFTDTDFTAYFTTVPREHLAVPLDIEADRMTRALIADDEVERERVVIHSEREGNENWPEFRVDEELYQLAFRHHPYRWDPLGRREDIERLTPEELRTYYQRFYGPRNAVLVVAGGFPLADTFSQIDTLFAALPPTGEDPVVTVREPEPKGERRSTLSGPGTTPILAVGWRAPGLDDLATPAVMMLDAVLGGECGLFRAGSLWGRSAEHPSARLYRGLVDPGLAVRAASGWRPRHDPSLFTVNVLAAEGVTLDRIEQALDALIDRLARAGPTRRELEDARAKVARGAALAYEGASRTGLRLGYFAAVQSLAFERTLCRRLLGVSSDEIRAAAQALLRPDRRVVVRYEPTGDEPDG